MKKLLLMAIVAMLGVSACGVNEDYKEDNQAAKQERVKCFHPTYIGGKWHYFYY